MVAGSKCRILEVARDLFYRKGYQAASVDDIIAGARVSKSNFYYHFRSKEDLGLAVVSQRRKQFEDRIAASLVDGPPSPRERLAQFLMRIPDSRETESTGGCPFGNLVAEMAEHSERLRCQLSEMFGDLLALIETVVTEGQEQGEIRSDVSPRDAAGLIVHTIQGAQLMAKCHRSHETYEHGVAALLTLLQAPRSRAGTRGGSDLLNP